MSVVREFGLIFTTRRRATNLLGVSRLYRRMSSIRLSLLHIRLSRVFVKYPPQTGDIYIAQLLGVID